MKVSVSVTTYNHERFIAQALDGVLMQDVDLDYEIVVGDDCSTDRTREIVLEYRSRFPDRIRTVLPARNLGDGGRPMFVETIRACRGELIAMLDGDDYWTAPDKLRKQVAFLEAHPECSMCYHNALVVYDDGTRPPEPFHQPGTQPALSTTEDLLWSCFIPALSPMMRRDAIDFPPWYFRTPWADRPLYLLAAERGAIGYIDEILGVYRVHAGGLWSALDPVSQIEGAIRLFDHLDERLLRRYRGTVRRVLGWQNYQLARAHADNGDAWRAGWALWRSLRYDPAASRTGYRRLLRVARRAYERHRSRTVPPRPDRAGRA